MVLEEIYKAGEVHPENLPRNFESLSARQQVDIVFHSEVITSRFALCSFALAVCLRFGPF